MVAGRIIIKIKFIFNCMVGGVNAGGTFENSYVGRKLVLDPNHYLD